VIDLQKVQCGPTGSSLSSIGLSRKNPLVISSPVRSEIPEKAGLMTETDHEPALGRKPATPQLLKLSVLFAVLTLPAMKVDGQLASSIAGWERDAAWMQLLDVFRFAGSLPVLLAIGLLILLIDPSTRRRMLRLLATLLTAAVTTGVLKVIFSRQRPGSIDLDDPLWSSFPGLFDSLGSGQQGTSLLNWSLGGFPSGHVTSAVVAAVGLGWLYPRGRWLFTGIALLVAAQRLAFEHHFLSDLFAAAAVATLVAGILASSRGPGGWFDRFELAGQPADK
jgi:membrane-associated phospholipid phosphatase